MSSCPSLGASKPALRLPLGKDQRCLPLARKGILELTSRRQAGCELRLRLGMVGRYTVSLYVRYVYVHRSWPVCS